MCKYSGRHISDVLVPSAPQRIKENPKILTEATAITSDLIPLISGELQLWSHDLNVIAMIFLGTLCV